MKALILSYISLTFFLIQPMFYFILQSELCPPSIARSSHRRCVAKNLPKFTRKHLCQSLFLNTVLVEFSKIFYTFFTQLLRGTASAWLKRFKVSPAGIYMFKVSNGNTRTMCAIYSKLTSFSCLYC